MSTEASDPIRGQPPDATESPATVSSTTEGVVRRRKREPVTTLEGFFARRAVKPASFLKDMREADRWGFELDDVAATLETHGERDKDFARTTQLLAASMKDPERRFARPVVEFAEVAIRPRLAENPHFAGRSLEAVGEAEAKLDLTVRALAPRLRESKRRAESTNLLLATTLCLVYSDGLPAATAIDRLVATLSTEPGRASDRGRASLVWLGERPKEVRAVVDLLASSVRRANELSDAVARLEEDVDAARARRLTAEQEAVRLSTEVADLKKAVTDARAEIERLDELSRAAGLHADHDVKRVKARIAGMLDGQLRDLVATIDEALSVDPPHVDVAREKAAAVMRELEGQVAWLRS